MQERERKNPFWQAVDAAKEITTRNPEERQPEKHQQLLTILKGLSKKTQLAVLFRLVNEVLEEQASIQGLFAVAREIGILPVAHGASAILKVIREGCSFDDLQDSGLAEIRTREANNGAKAYIVYFVGQKALWGAAEHFRKTEQISFAQVLEEHLRRGERYRRLARARLEAQKTPNKVGTAA